MKKIASLTALLVLTYTQIFALSPSAPLVQAESAPLTNFKSFVIVESGNKKIPEVISVPSFGNGFEAGFAIQSVADGDLISGYVRRDTSLSIASSSLLFLAQPNVTYRVYIDSDDLRKSSGIDISLASLENKYIHKVKSGEVRVNSAYREKDRDSDGVPDVRDNCVSLANSSQVDLNSDGRGDECDDFDFDGIINSSDNCVNIPNQRQEDEDNDGIGDVCDKVESRLTEKYPWLPWVGIVAAAAVLLTLTLLTVRDSKKEKLLAKSENESKTV